ncbi:MAG TPA: CinA family protein [Ilumatobacteraceae bacterium]|nr:CinA family protein [Ilumatobacteraceae bacterium]
MGHVELATEAARLLGGRSIATAESCTAGRLAESLASVDKAVDFLRGGLVAYQDQVKRSFLGVTAESTLSADAAAQMALGACRMFESDVAVATTGVAGDEPADGVPPGTVFIATAVDGVVRVQRYRYEADPPTVCDLARYQGLVDLQTALAAVR